MREEGRAGIEKGHHEIAAKIFYPPRAHGKGEFNACSPSSNNDDINGSRTTPARSGEKTFSALEIRCTR